MDANPYGIGDEEFGYSLANLIELLVACLTAAGARSVLEVGALHGTLTRALARWAEGAGARLVAIDPEPEAGLLALAESNPAVELVREPSPGALAKLLPADAVILDGDHNHFTLTGELRAIESGSEDSFPLVFVHDVGWPHGRRDAYHDPDGLPAEAVRPLAHDALLRPGIEGIADGGLAFDHVAATEGGERNGVLTALEDFVAGRSGLRVAQTAAFFGLAVVWPAEASWSDAVAAIMEPLDGNPWLARLEENRIDHLVARVRQVQVIHDEHERRSRLEQLLTRLHDSRAFAVAAWVTRLRRGGKPLYSREELRGLLGDPSEE
jgi:SAM-dependent methyltransferase